MAPLIRTRPPRPLPNLLVLLALAGGGVTASLAPTPATAEDARERMTRMALAPASAAPAVVAGPTASATLSAEREFGAAAGPTAGGGLSVATAVSGPALAAGGAAGASSGASAGASALSDEHRPLTTRPQPSRDAESLPPAEGRTGATGGYMLHTLAALGVVIGLLYGLKAIAAKLGGFEPARASAAVEVLSRTAVGPKGHVLLLRVGGRVLVVGDSAAGGLRTLDCVEGDDEVAELLRATQATASPGLDFGALLSAAGRKREPGGLGETEDLVETGRPGNLGGAAGSGGRRGLVDPLAGVKARLERLGSRA